MNDVIYTKCVMDGQGWYISSRIAECNEKIQPFSCWWLIYCVSVLGGPGGGAVPVCQPHLEHTQWDGNDEWLGGGRGGHRTQIMRDTLASIKNVLNHPTDQQSPFPTLIGVGLELLLYQYKYNSFEAKCHPSPSE